MNVRPVRTSRPTCAGRPLCWTPKYHTDGRGRVQGQDRSDEMDRETNEKYIDGHRKGDYRERGGKTVEMENEKRERKEKKGRKIEEEQQR